VGKSSTAPPGDITPWIYKAEGDFRTASTMSRKRKDPAPDNVCFCAHQCAEKYLKAFLVFHKRLFPKTHHLQALLDFAVDIDPALENLRELLLQLEPYGVEIRYPGENASVEESKAAVKHMICVRRTLRKTLGLPP
jgi:HEPN domain-containing protein